MSIHSVHSSNLTYQVMRDAKSGALHFDPPERSKDLRDALFVRFHEEPDYKSRIQKAIVQFCRQEGDERRQFRYSLTRNNDGDPEFTPKRGTTELRDALHYHFPEALDYESRIKQAILAQRDREAEKSFSELSLDIVDCASSTASLTRTLTRRGSGLSSRPISRQTIAPVRSKRLKRQYSPSERYQVSLNRGKVCEWHKEKRTKVRTIIPADHPRLTPLSAIPPNVKATSYSKNFLRSEMRILHA
jgi:hypothetical protein